MSNRAGDPYVKNVQEWINNTFEGEKGYTIIIEDGIVGWNTIYALLHGLQISLNVGSTANNFGNGTINAFNSYIANNGNIEEQYEEITDKTRININGIVQGALICKGYDIGRSKPNGQFLAKTGDAVKRLKSDMGLSDTSTIITLNIMKALLSMDYFMSYSTSERVQNIVKIQRYLNGNYENYIGIRPCDGAVSRSTSSALIYAIQAEENMPVGVADGICGPATKKHLPPIPYSGGYNYNGELYGISYEGNKYTPDSIEKFKILANIGLYFNGFGSGVIESSIDTEIIKNFQSFYAIPVTGKIDFTTWLSLIISCGDANREAIACDCATLITEENVEVLIHNNYRYIGRYLSGTIWNSTLQQYESKALTLNEVKLLFRNGIRLFPLYQGNATTISYFTTAQAESDAKRAIECAESFYLQFGTIIYFAVDFDAMDFQITSTIIPYFEKLHDTFMNACKGKYRVGVYGTRNVCSRVCSDSLANSSFVSDMSTGYSGNLGYVIPWNWALDQFATTTISYKGKSIKIDKDGFSGSYYGILQEYSNFESSSEISEMDTNKNSFLLVNRSGLPIKVYELKIHKDWELPQTGTQYVVDGDIVGEIKNNALYLFFGITNPSRDNVHKVLFNDGRDVKMGYIIGNYEDVNPEDNLFVQNWKQRALSQEPLSCVRYNKEEDSYVTESFSSEHIIYVNTPIPYFDRDANYLGLLSKGDYLYISGNNTNICGEAYPWNHFVDKINHNGKMLSDGYFVSAGLEYSPLGYGRAWY